MERLFKVALVGRPNVGKSTIFNRMIGRRKSFTFGVPGITRDFISGKVNHAGVEFELIDTGGFIPDPEEELVHLVTRQVLRAIDDADMVILVLDGKEGILPADSMVVDLLRVNGKQFITAVNKVDYKRARENIPSVYELGIDNFHEVSAEHGTGIIELMDDVSSRVTVLGEDRETEDLTGRVSIVGRPNVGKSTLLNTILGEERVIVSSIPGTTRDSIDAEVCFGEEKLIFVDTAGIKQKAKTVEAVEKIMSIRSLGSIKKSDISILVVDLDQGPTHQDLQIMRRIIRAGKGVIVGANKSDLLREGSLKEKLMDFDDAFSFASFAPIIPISAEKNRGIEELLGRMGEVIREYGKRVPTPPLNREAEKFLFKRSVPGPGKLNRAYYLTQTGTSPPAFSVFVKDPRGIPESFGRFISNNIRKHFGFDGCPIVIRYRRK